MKNIDPRGPIKARINWGKDGYDTLNMYFHYLKGKQPSNKTLILKDIIGNLIDDQDKIKDTLYAHFQSLLSSNGCNVDCLATKQPIVHLSWPLEKDELFQTLCDMVKGKSVSLVGLPHEFYLVLCHCTLAI